MEMVRERLITLLCVHLTVDCRTKSCYITTINTSEYIIAIVNIITTVIHNNTNISYETSPLSSLISISFLCLIFFLT